ncbi:unnamed protein product [Ectocarpus sp. CCAP 1310/34]|nr:unnamed protein product [Ectocarpus sp. CCAP 1310/34]
MRRKITTTKRPGAEARGKPTLQEKLAYAGIRTPDLTCRGFRDYQLDHRGGTPCGVTENVTGVCYLM